MRSQRWHWHSRRVSVWRVLYIAVRSLVSQPMCFLHTPASPPYPSYKLFIPSLSHIRLPPLLLLTPTPLSSPLPPPPLSLTFSTSISSHSSFFFSLSSSQLVYCSGKVSELSNLYRLPFPWATPRPLPPMPSLLPPQQLADSWLITSWNVYCTRAI